MALFEQAQILISLELTHIVLTLGFELSAGNTTIYDQKFILLPFVSCFDDLLCRVIRKRAGELQREFREKIQRNFLIAQRKEPRKQGTR